MFVPPLFVHMGCRLTIESRLVDQDMFAHFCGFGPGHKSTHNITKVFRNVIKEAFGLADDDMDDTSATQAQAGEHGEGIDEEADGDTQPRECIDGEESEDESDSDGKEDSEDSEEDFGDPDKDYDLDHFAFEDDLGYAPL